MAGGLNHKFGMFFIFWGLLHACPSRSVNQESEWISNPGGEVEEIIESDFSQDDETEWGQKTSTLPEDIEALTELLLAVAGPDDGLFFDSQFDEKVSNDSEGTLGTQGQVSSELNEDRNKRFIGMGVLSSVVPALTKFGGGILKNMLSQLIYRSHTKMLYSQNSCHMPYLEQLWEAAKLKNL